MASEAFRDRTAWARNMAAPVRDFLSTETGSGVVLVGAVVAALVWANSPWHSSYESVWGTKLSIHLGHSGISLPLRQWVNQGLMTFFFLVVGLEAKRELDLGELRERRRIAVPVVAALGGAAGSVLVYLAFNLGGTGAHGWGVAMSSDTAFALGVLALMARGATRLRVFLLTLAIVDDLIGLVVIATAYTSHVSLLPLAIAAALFAFLFAGRYVPLWWRRKVVVIAGVGVWIALLESGIDPVISGLAVGLISSAYPPSRSELERVTELARSFREQPTPELARSAQLGLLSAISANDRLQYSLHPWTSYVIVPLFALANAGIHVNGSLLSDAVGSPITIGILVAYATGKPLGVLASSWLASRRPFGGRLTLSWPALAAGGVVAGIGFTVSLLIASIAFHGRELAEAKLGVLASAIAGPILAAVAFQAMRRLPAELRARQIVRTADPLLDLSDDVAPDRDHIRGPEDAPVTLIEYGDYECPYCGQAEVAIRELLVSFGDELRYVWRHLPLNDVHTHAQMAAEAAEAAAAEGRFWEMHEALLRHQDALRRTDLDRYAHEIGLDADRLWEALETREYAPRIAEDVASADASGVAGTPSFFINGRRHEGAYDVETLSAAVRAARGRARLQGAAAAREPAQPVGG